MFRIFMFAMMFLALSANSIVTGGTKADAGRRVALIIGNSSYQNAGQLLNPRNDAEALEAALTRLGFEVELALDVTLSGMVEPVRRFTQRLRGVDVALLFYAGHGLSFQGENYIVPIEASAKDVIDIGFGMLSVRKITDEMAMHARLNIVLLDACRDNPLVRSANRSLGDSGRSAVIKQGLSRLEQIGRQSYIMLATKEGEVASDGTGAHSPFSEALLNHIETEGLEISELARRVRKDVREATDGRQVPLTIGSLDDPFYFLPSGKEPEVTAPVTAPVPTENAHLTAACASSVRTSEPAKGQLKFGECVCVADGECPDGQIKEVCGAKTRSHHRTRRCISLN
jgi:uncharacterized caspase-like protein